MTANESAAAVPPARSREGELALSAHGLGVTYSNGARGMWGLDLDVRRGEVVAILGRNGAGKTSALRAMAGYPRNERVSVVGSVRINGHETVGGRPSVSARAGAVLVPERNKVFTSLTVAEHLRLVQANKDAPLMFESLGRLLDRRAGLLSGGERQMLALEVAWRRDPSVLLIDEMSLGLAPVIVKNLMRMVGEVASQQNTAVVVVEQDVMSALSIADYVYVLDHGELVWEGTRDETDASLLGQRYLGMMS